VQPSLYRGVDQRRRRARQRITDNEGNASLWPNRRDLGDEVATTFSLWCRIERLR
jgi:hypothetical protein